MIRTTDHLCQHFQTGVLRFGGPTGHPVAGGLLLGNLLNQKQSGLAEFIDVLTVADETTQAFRLEALFEASFEGIDAQESNAIGMTLKMLKSLCVRPQTDLAMVTEPTRRQPLIWPLQHQERSENRRLRGTGHNEVNVVCHQDFIKPERDRPRWNRG